MSIDRMVDKLISAKGATHTRIVMIVALAWIIWRVEANTRRLVNLEVSVAVIKFRLGIVTPDENAKPGASPMAQK